MTDDVTNTTDSSDGPKQLREAYERAQARIAELESQARSTAFEKAGLDPSKGIGKAVAALYDGDPSPDAIVEFAKTEFDWEPTGTQAQTDKERMVAQAQDRLDQVQAASSQVTAPDESTIDDQIATAESEGNWNAAMQLKMQKALDSFS
ncbi:MAG: hypothetical protein GWN97_22450 [Thermoplasmata archaeon]|nr:hypothetical protein [Thermoplasmata archaeon]NIT80333.1 hypothetical protein [Thermoplasmata archaeon]NIY06701.1 hypothetical protein [Thermoplasmata archaeon]